MATIAESFSYGRNYPQVVHGETVVSKGIEFISHPESGFSVMVQTAPEGKMLDSGEIRKATLFVGEDH